MRYHTRENSIYVKVVKRGIDFLIALVTVLLLWWLFLIIAVAIRVDSSGPAIFKQERLGKNMTVYTMYKFRTMTVGAEHTGTGVYSDDNDIRVTRVGRFLRKTSLDEIPQVFNILKGDVALIGYRSPLTYHPWPMEEWTEEQKTMFVLRPGITGWAQVNGRRTVEWHDRIAMNIWYAEHVSFLLDLKIFFMTFFKVAGNVDNENLGETVNGENGEQLDAQTDVYNG